MRKPFAVGARIVRSAVLAAAAAAAAALSTSAMATSPMLSVPKCAEHDDMVRILAKEYKEAPKALGLVGGQRVMQVFVSKQGTWTIVVTRTSGDTCIVAAGQNWEEVPMEVGQLDPRA
ncbi:hypothetical protein [Afifella marina]|uniref:Uncharacterized protein n=2 Tax=Afifella marina TaxID=1080 RepID=A0A1G5NME8_AFIMA|nr:hypothetical protein [Afifella marina]SCZ38593.1 hypothetical protein SAMN03080610_02300 [Afifella marina DSM 2698]